MALDYCGVRKHVLLRVRSSGVFCSESSVCVVRAPAPPARRSGRFLCVSSVCCVGVCAPQESPDQMWRRCLSGLTPSGCGGNVRCLLDAVGSSVPVGINVPSIGVAPKTRRLRVEGVFQSVRPTVPTCARVVDDVNVRTPGAPQG